MRPPKGHTAAIKGQWRLAPLRSEKARTHPGKYNAVEFKPEDYGNALSLGYFPIGSYFLDMPTKGWFVLRKVEPVIKNNQPQKPIGARSVRAGGELQISKGMFINRKNAPTAWRPGTMYLMQDGTARFKIPSTLRGQDAPDLTMGERLKLKTKVERTGDLFEQEHSVPYTKDVNIHKETEDKLMTVIKADDGTVKLIYKGKDGVFYTVIGKELE